MVSVAESRVVSDIVGTRPTIRRSVLQGSFREQCGEPCKRYHDADQNDRLACTAFLTVFRQKQTQHGALLSWLEKSLVGARISDAAERRVLESAITKP